MTLSQLDTKRKQIQDKIIVGIDPANDKHQGFIIDEYGIGIGKTFSFGNNYKGLTTTLWYHFKKRLKPEQISPEKLIFAIEASIDFWQVLTDYLTRKGYTVALVSPLTTKKTRVLPGNDFSRTDPKDARMIAENTAKGYFHWYRNESSREKAMKTLSLTYDKLRKDLQANQARLRSQVKRIFPEFLKIVTLNTETALYLLSNYLYPDEYLTTNVESESLTISRISKRQYNISTLLDLQKAAANSIGIPKTNDEQIADKLAVTSFIGQIQLLKKQLKEISRQLIKLASESSDFKILTSLKGISDLTASIFLAEIQDHSQYQHYKQIQKLAGLNLRLNISGNGRYYALETLTPTVDGLGTASLDVQTAALDTVADRLAYLRYGDQGIATGDGTYTEHMWMQAFGSVADQGERNGVDGFEASGYGIAIGFDSSDLYTDALAGFSVAYSAGDVDGKSAADAQTDISSYMLNGYYSRDLQDDIYVDAMLGLAYNTYEGERTVTVGSFNRKAKSDFDGWQVSGRAAVGRHYAMGGNLQLIPEASAQYTYLTLDKYTETGAGGANLTVDADDNSALVLALGGTAAWDFEHAGGSVMRAELRGKYTYDLIGDELTATSSFAGGGASFKTEGAKVAQHGVVLGAGVKLLDTAGMEFGVDYDATLKADYVNHSGQFKVRWAF